MSKCVPFWDFDENKNYVSISINGKNYKVLNLPDAYQAATLMYEIDLFIHKKISNLRSILHRFNLPLRNNMELLSSTPFSVQEMQVSSKNCPVYFEGLNKPKNVRRLKKVAIIGKDENLRAERRTIFFKIRNRNGKLKSLKQLESLIIHEIAHTACNHVRWRDDDHGADFKLCEHVITMYI